MLVPLITYSFVVDPAGIEVFIVCASSKDSVLGMVSVR
jgi:hypothetical protein